MCLPGTHQHGPPSRLPPTPRHQPQGGAGRAVPRKFSTKPCVCPSGFGYRRPAGRPPASPAKAWHRGPSRAAPCQRPGPECAGGPFSQRQLSPVPPPPREKASLFPPPRPAPAWLRDARAPGCGVTRPRRIHLQPHRLPGNRIPAADDSHGQEDRASIQPPPELPGPTWRPPAHLRPPPPCRAAPELGTGLPQPVLPRGMPGATARNGGLGRAPCWGPGTGVLVGGDGGSGPHRQQAARGGLWAPVRAERRVKGPPTRAQQESGPAHFAGADDWCACPPGCPRPPGAPL